MTILIPYDSMNYPNADNSRVRDLRITYRTNKLEKICTDSSVARKEYGTEMAEKISQRVNELTAAPSVEMLLQFQIGRCHRLKGDRKKQFAMDLVQPFRLVFEKVEKELQLVKIVEIENYH